MVLKKKGRKDACAGSKACAVAGSEKKGLGKKKPKNQPSAAQAELSRCAMGGVCKKTALEI